MKSSSWTEVKLGEILNLRRGHDLTRDDMVLGSFPVLGSNGLIGWHTEHKGPKPLIVVGRSGTVGQVQIIDNFCWPHNTTLYVDDFKGNNPYFLFYLLKNLSLKNYRGGSAVPTLNRNHLHPLKITFNVDLKSQENIVKILKSIDDKIEINNKINSTLEELAQTLYKRWFVDFEFPNEEGRPYKSSGGKMIESEVGSIPEGWIINKLDDLVDVERGLSYKGKHLADSGVPMINLGSVRSKGGYNYEKIKYYDGNYKARNIVSKGDIIVANTDMTSSRDILGTPIIVPDIYKGDVIFSHHLYAFRNLRISRSYLYYYLKSDIFKSISENYANGTTVLAIAKNDIEKAPIIFPNNTILNYFNSVVDGIISKVSNNEIQNIKLSAIRDLILPKLMSGEIEV